MDSKTISSPFIRARRPARIDATLLALAALALILAVAVILVQAPVSDVTLAPPVGAESFLAQNPELSVARRYVAPVESVREEWTLARNPELMANARYMATASPDAATFLSLNPELSAVRRYTEIRAAR